MVTTVQGFATVKMGLSAPHLMEPVHVLMVGRETTVVKEYVKNGCTGNPVIKSATVKMQTQNCKSFPYQFNIWFALSLLSKFIYKTLKNMMLIVET